LWRRLRGPPLRKMLVMQRPCLLPCCMCPDDQRLRLCGYATHLAAEWQSFDSLHIEGPC
jgi:hypothetical protein